MKLIPILLISLFLFGCGTSREIFDVETSIGERPTVAKADRPRKLNLNKIHWYVVTNENLETFLEEMKNVQGEVVFYAITPKSYENMSINMSDILRYLKSQKAIIVYYEDFLYNKTDSFIDNPEE